jgi:hypothetical protein
MDTSNYDAEVARLVDEAIEAATGETKNSVASKAHIAHATFERKLGAGGFKVSEIMRIARVLNVPPASLLPEQVA